MHVIIGVRALDDLQEIWEFLAEDNQATANRVVLELIERAESVAERPLAGRAEQCSATGRSSTKCGKRTSTCTG